MLIEFKVKSRMAICYLDWLRFRSQQVLDMLLYKQGAAEDIILPDFQTDTIMAV